MQYPAKTKKNRKFYEQYPANNKQEAQLMLTNPCDAFRSQSASPNMIPFDDMLGMVSYYCPIVTLSLRRAVFFQIFDFKKFSNLEIRVRGHSRSSEPIRHL